MEITSPMPRLFRRVDPPTSEGIPGARGLLRRVRAATRTIGDRRNRGYHDCRERLPLPCAARSVRARDRLRNRRASRGPRATARRRRRSEPRHGRRRRRRHPHLDVHSRDRARPWTSARRSTLSFSPISFRMSTIWSRSSTAFACIAGQITRVIINSYSRAWRPLIRAAETRRREAPQADPQLGRRPRRTESLGHYGLRGDHRDAHGSCCPEACAGPVDLARTACWRTSGRSTTSASRGGSSHAQAEGPTRERRPYSSWSPAGTSAGTFGRSSDGCRPDVGTATEVVFVEGGSRDGTREEIKAVVAEPHDDSRPRFVQQSGQRQG